MTDERTVASIRSQLVEAVRQTRITGAEWSRRRTASNEAAHRQADKWKWTLVNVLYGYPDYRGFAAELEAAEALVGQTS
jgi:hypothetical protein